MLAWTGRQIPWMRLRNPSSFAIGEWTRHATVCAQSARLSWRVAWRGWMPRYIFATESQAELAGWKAALLGTGNTLSAAGTTPGGGIATNSSIPTSDDSVSAKSVEFASPLSSPSANREPRSGGCPPRQFSEERFRARSDRSFSVASELSYHSADLQPATSARSMSETEQRQRRVALVAELEAQLAADAVLLSPEASQLIERLKLACATL